MALHCFPSEGFPRLILEEGEAENVSPRQLDTLLESGWRHFGSRFFRYNLALHGGIVCGVLPLRIRLSGFFESSAQRRVTRRNADLETRIGPTCHGAEYDAMFDRHKARFVDNVPDSLRDFLSGTPSRTPCENVAVELRKGGELVAVSFMDVGAVSTSSVYAMFEPAHARRSAGLCTILREIVHAATLGKEFHYLGYAYTVPSSYDYKLGFAGLEAFDWGHGWAPLPKECRWSRIPDALEELAAR